MAVSRRQPPKAEPEEVEEEVENIDDDDEPEVSEDEDIDGDESEPEDSGEEEGEQQDESEAEGEEEGEDDANADADADDAADDDEQEEEEAAAESESPSSPSTDKPARRVGRPRKEENQPKVKLSKKEAAELFKRYDDRRELIRELNEHLANAKEEMSQAAFDIYDKLGVGPFKWKGKTLKVFKSKKNPNAARIRTISDEALEIG